MAEFYSCVAIEQGKWPLGVILVLAAAMLVVGV